MPVEPQLPDPPLHGPGPPNHMNNLIISDQEVLDQIHILNVNKPWGPDGISPLIIKIYLYLLLNLLQNYLIFPYAWVNSLACGKFPI